MKTKEIMNPLTDEELHSIYGGNIFSSIVAWFKRHFCHETIDEHSWESISKPGYDGTAMYGVSFDI